MIEVAAQDCPSSYPSDADLDIIEHAGRAVDLHGLAVGVYLAVLLMVAL